MWRTGLALTLMLSAGGCGASQRPVPHPPPAPRDLGALETLAPAASTTVLVLSPSSLLADPASASVVSALFPDARLERFRVRTGVDPRTLEALVLILHPEGRAVIARGPIDASLAVMEAGARMAPLESSQDEPFPRRAGFLGSRRIELAAPSANVVVWVDGTPALSSALLHAAALDESERDHPFERADLSEIQEELGSAPLLLFSPHPLGLPLDQGIGMLLARERALGLAMQPVGADRLQVRAAMRGEFPPGATENFAQLGHSMAASELGGALGLREALPTYEVVAAEDHVAASVEVSVSRLALGLRAILVAPIEELLDAPPTTPLPERSHAAAVAATSEEADLAVVEPAEPGDAEAP
ncbi:MAG: hypothetical protein AB8I08_24670 [Sandaracinaceae bacterium]